MHTLTAKQVSTKIKSIASRSVKLSDDIQSAAVACAQHSHLYGDYTLAVALIEAVGKGAKREALRLWLQKFGAMTVTSRKEQQEGASSMRYAKSQRLEGEALEAKIEEAKGTPWYEAPTERDAHSFSVASGFASLMRKIEKSIAEGKEFSEEDQKLVDALRKVAVL